VPQRFFNKFPKTVNRVKLSDNRDRNRVNREIQSGYQKRPFPHVPSGRCDRFSGKVEEQCWPNTHMLIALSGLEPYVIGETVNEMLDSVSAHPVSSHPHLPVLNW
jgi:hypothetical protein